MVKRVIDARHILGAMAFDNQLSTEQFAHTMGVGFDDIWGTTKEFYDINKPIADAIFTHESDSSFLSDVPLQMNLVVASLSSISEVSSYIFANPYISITYFIF